MARFKKSSIPTTQYIEELALDAARDPEKLKELGQLAEKLGRRANQNLRELERQKYSSDAYKYAQNKTGREKPRYSQAAKGSAMSLAENAIASAEFLRLKTSTVGGVREKARPGFKKLVEKSTKAYKKKAGKEFTDKESKKLERSMTKFLNSKAFEELKTLGSDVIDATYEAIQNGADIDELLKAYEAYERGEIEGGILTVWDDWITAPVKKAMQKRD